MIFWPPKGYLNLIKREHSLAMTKASSGELPDWDWTMLHAVNDEVNVSATYAPDEMGKDVWGAFTLVGPGKLAGDCDDFAVEKLRRLLALHWPRDKLRLAICQTTNRILHCVLLVYISDNNPAILDSIGQGIWVKDRKRGYVWLAEEWPGHETWWRTF